ncbi:ionotropic receptor 21a-like [Macrobrachium rosenbergii]|uniref:ionotropic receptor 21a-like n=1 Tax=Macrobrachium rosenbergii TaxID=79674 RepID=UPI0034D4C8B8
MTAYRSLSRFPPPLYCLLVFLPISRCLLSKESQLGTEASLTVLEEVMARALEGRNVVLYIDQTIDSQLIQRLLLALVNRSITNVIVNLSYNGSLWSDQQTSEILRGSAFTHVVVFQTEPTPFFQSLSLQWNPKYLLLYSLLQEPFHVLMDNSFKRIEKLALVTALEPRSDTYDYMMGVYTLMPFHRGERLRLVKVLVPDTEAVGLEDIFVDRFESFEGYEFHLGTWFDDFPYLYQSKTKPEGVGDGVEVEMLDAIAQVLNYSYTLTPKPPDLKWGAFKNGSWTGMLGMVYRGDKNFTVNYFVITRERVSAFDATLSYGMEGFGMSMRSPPPLPKWRGLYYPFTPSVWLSVVCTTVFVVMLMAVQDRLQPHPFLKTFGRTWIYLVRLNFNQGLPTLPESQWQRVFIGFWVIYCFIITISYTANLIAFLTIPVFPKRIQTVQQLAESQYGVTMYDYGEFVPGALISSQDPYYRILGERLELFPTYDGAVEPMLAGTHAYIESFSYNRILISVDYKAKNSYMLREQLYPGHLCWYFQKNTAWKYKFDHGIQQLVESGLITYWLKIKNEEFLGRDFERRQQLLEAEAGGELSLTLEHLQGAFFLLLISWLSSTLALLTEILHKHCCCQAKTKTT